MNTATPNSSWLIQQFAADGFRCALTELDVDMIPRALHWNAKTREDTIKQNPSVDGCPEEILNKQAAIYREVMQAVMANVKHVDRVTVWGISLTTTTRNGFRSPMAGIGTIWPELGPHWDFIKTGSRAFFGQAPKPDDATIQTQTSRDGEIRPD